MKYIIIAGLIIAGLPQTTKAQTDIPCEQKTWVVNVGSIEDHIDIYHSGHYLTNPREENAITWIVTDNQGTIIAQETLIDESRFDFYHNIPTTETMNISAELINETAGVACFVEDVLFWDTVNSSGRWEFLYGNTPTTLGGQDNQLLDITITPTLIDTYFELISLEKINMTVYDTTGKSVKMKKITTDNKKVLMDDMPAGIYFVHLTNDQNISQTIKVIKK
ncbi:T9SS type A sorting domain-containing protein [Flavobacteriaceae bacterium]|nr:T9SS type A sorting domain-containing protein [Flavobacteriaceae bacterium]